MNVTSQRVQLVAWTQFQAPEGVPWSTDADGGQALAEFAGRACYQSWSKPNPKTATNAGYLAHILETGHFSVLEHGSVSFYFSGISRSLTHELIRHRHFSYSQLSQRYVPQEGVGFVIPPAVATAMNPRVREKFGKLMSRAQDVYDAIREELEAEFGTSSTTARKLARQAARAVLPNAVETRIVVTGNYRAWRHFIAMRATEHADVEIRELAVECLRQLQRVAPNVFGDFTISPLDDGTEVATSPYAERS